MLNLFFKSLIHICFGMIFLRFFVNLSVSFIYFLKWVSVLKFPLTVTEYYGFNNVPSIESLKLLTIIERKIAQNERRFNRATFC